MPRPADPLDDAHALRAEIERLREEVARLAQGERLQRALFAIADLSGSELDLPEMLRRIHAIVGSLMYAENFFIVKKVRGRDTFRMLYFADSVDAERHDPDEERPLAELDGSLTWHVLLSGRPLRGSRGELQAKVGMPLRAIGTDSLDWLGVPMLQGDLVRGAGQGGQVGLGPEVEREVDEVVLTEDLGRDVTVAHVGAPTGR